MNRRRERLDGGSNGTAHSLTEIFVIQDGKICVVLVVCVVLLACQQVFKLLMILACDNDRMFWLGLQPK